jgi:PAS domain S-box-containing protein
VNELETRARDRTTELAQANKDLVDSAERLGGVIESAMDAIITVDEAQKITIFNAAAERIFGCPAAQALGGPLNRFIPARFREAHHGHIERFGQTGTTTRRMGARLTLFGLRANGEEFPIDASISQVRVGEKFYTVILRDVSERRRAEEALERSYGELRELSRIMNEVREAERTRVARELHDELAQWLTALKMDVAWLAARLPAGQHSLVERTERMKGVVDTTVASIRRIAADLRPVMLDDLGLAPSLENLLSSLSERANIAVRLDVQPRDLDLKDPLATAVYRMVQEALTNVARHAQATEVRVTLVRAADALIVRVSDNGVGLPPPTQGRKSYGLLGIRERAQTLGGSARIYGPPEGGTMVEISIPLARYAGTEAAT